jgi:hypothetical protein
MFQQRLLAAHQVSERKFPPWSLFAHVDLSGSLLLQGFKIIFFQDGMKI